MPSSPLLALWKINLEDLGPRLTTYSIFLLGLSSTKPRFTFFRLDQVLVSGGAQ